MLPTLAVIKHEKTTDYIVGLDELGGSEDFSTGERAAVWDLCTVTFQCCGQCLASRGCCPRLWRV